MLKNRVHALAPSFLLWSFYRIFYRRATVFLGLTHIYLESISLRTLKSYNAMTRRCSNSPHLLTLLFTYAVVWVLWMCTDAKITMDLWISSLSGTFLNSEKFNCHWQTDHMFWFQIKEMFCTVTGNDDVKRVFKLLCLVHWMVGTQAFFQSISINF